MAIEFLEPEIPTESIQPKAKIEFLESEPAIEPLKVPTATISIPSEEKSLIQSLTQTKKDILEESLREDPVEFAKAAGTAQMEQFRGMKEMVQILGPKLARDMLTMRFGNPEQKNKLSSRRREQAIEVMKELPNTLKEEGLRFGESFGYDPDRNESPLDPENFDLDVFLQKLREAPLETGADVLIVTGLAKGVGKGIGKAVTKVAMPEKKAFQKILSKKDLETKTILQNVSNKRVATDLDNLYADSDLISKMDVGSQLDNPNFAIKLGEDATKKINRLKKRDQVKLKSAIRKIGDQDVNKVSIEDSLKDSLVNTGLIAEGTGKLDVGLIEPGIAKTQLLKEIKRLKDPEPLTVSQLKSRLDNIDNKINFNNIKEADKGLLDVRNAYRSYIREASPDYDQTALLVSEKLDKFDRKLKSLDKVGSGEKFGKAGFQTKEEMTEFLRLMEKSPDKIAGAIAGDLKTLRAVQNWNSFFKQNPNLYLPFVRPEIQKAIKKRLIKGDIALGQPGKAAKSLIRITGESISDPKAFKAASVLERQTSGI